MFRLLKKEDHLHEAYADPGGIDDSFLEQELSNGLRARVHTIAQKTKVSEGVAELIAQEHVLADSAARIEVSRPDQVEGLRRLVLLGRRYDPMNDVISYALKDHGYVRKNLGPGAITMIGVTEDGLLFRRGIHVEGQALTGKEALHIARFTPEIMTQDGGMADFGINKRSQSNHALIEDITGKIMTESLQTLTRDQSERLPKPFFKGLEYVTRKRITKRVNLAIYALNDALDPELLRLMRGCALNSLDEVEWICGRVTPENTGIGPGKWFGASLSEMHDRDLSIIRAQAVRAYPALAKSMIRTESFREAVDGRSALAPVIAQHLNIPVKNVRALSHLTWQRASVRPSDPKKKLAEIASIPTDFAPTSRPEYQQIRFISEFAAVLGEPLSQTIRRFGTGGSPYRFGGDLRRISAGDVRDAALYIAEKLIFPANLHALRRISEREGERLTGAPGGRFRKQIASDLMRTISIREMFDLSDRWHRNLARHEDRLVTLMVDDEWTPFIGNVSLDQITARELSSSRDLQNQGRHEGHCVGGYTQNVLRASPGAMTLIFSLERDQKILGTAEIRLECEERDGTSSREAPKWSARVAQNRSAHNSDVTAAAKSAAEKLCTILADRAAERGPDYQAGVREVRSSGTAFSRLPSYVKAAGYDVWDMGQMNLAWDELSGYLPRSMRKSGLEGMISLAEDRMINIRTTAVESMSFEHQVLDPGLSIWDRDARLIGEFRGENLDLPKEPANNELEDEWHPYPF